MTKRGRRALECIACIAALAAIVTLAQACGGGSGGEDASPTATSPPAAAAGSETPLPGLGFTPGAGAPGGGPFIGGASEELAVFLGISLEELESELSEENATPASVAEAHGRTREELKAFFTEQQQAQLSEAVAAEDMSQDDADQMLEAFASRIDDIIDGNVPVRGGPGAGHHAWGPGSIHRRPQRGVGRVSGHLPRPTGVRAQFRRRHARQRR